MTGDDQEPDSEPKAGWRPVNGEMHFDGAEEAEGERRRRERRMRILGMIYERQHMTRAELRDAVKDDRHTMKLNRFDQAIRKLFSDRLITNDLGHEIYRCTLDGEAAWVEYEDSLR